MYQLLIETVYHDDVLERKIDRDDAGMIPLSIFVGIGNFIEIYISTKKIDFIYRENYF